MTDVFDVRAVGLDEMIPQIPYGVIAESETHLRVEDPFQPQRFPFFIPVTPDGKRIIWYIQYLYHLLSEFKSHDEQLREKLEAVKASEGKVPEAEAFDDLVTFCESLLSPPKLSFLDWLRKMRG